MCVSFITSLCFAFLFRKHKLDFSDNISEECYIRQGSSKCLSPQPLLRIANTVLEKNY